MDNIKKIQLKAHLLQLEANIHAIRHHVNTGDKKLVTLMDNLFDEFVWVAAMIEEL